MVFKKGDKINLRRRKESFAEYGWKCNVIWWEDFDNFENMMGLLCIC